MSQWSSRAFSWRLARLWSGFTSTDHKPLFDVLGARPELRSRRLTEKLLSEALRLEHKPYSFQRFSRRLQTTGRPGLQRDRRSSKPKQKYHNHTGIIHECKGGSLLKWKDLLPKPSRVVILERGSPDVPLAIKRREVWRRRLVRVSFTDLRTRPGADSQRLPTVPQALHKLLRD